MWPRLWLCIVGLICCSLITNTRGESVIMLEGLLYWLLSLLPEVTVPLALTNGILGAVKYVYWANYYFPVDIAVECLLIVYAYYLSCYFFKFLIHSIDSVIQLI